MRARLEVKSESTGPVIDFKEIWGYKYLMLLFIRRDFVAKYKQNVLGPTWFILQPLLMTLVFTVIFGRIAGISTDGIPPMLFYLSGLAIWNYFAQTFTANSSILITQAPLYTKVYFPRMSLPIANVISNLMAFAVQLLLFLFFYLYFKLFHPSGSSFTWNWTVVFLPVYVLTTGMLSLGAGLWMSSLTAKYRDLVQLAAFFVQIGMYMTPIIYPLSEVPTTLGPIIRLNPMTAIVEGFRYCFLGEGSFSIGMLLYSLLISVVVMISGMVLFQRVQRSFVDSI